jgi:zinc transport system ATP-binding protein
MHETGAALHPVGRGISLRFREVSFSYGGIPVLDRVSFHLHQGEFIALVGPNGSGKTTVLKLLLGLEKPRAGLVELFPPLSLDRTGYVPQQAAGDRSFPITVEEVVRMGRLRPFSRGYGAEDREAVREALEELGIAPLARRPYGALSGGERRRVLAARALALRPSFLVLDEPTANMDRESEDRLFRTLGKLKGQVTILIVTHNMDFVSPLTDRALCMGSGEGGLGIVQHPVRPLAGETGKTGAAGESGGTGEARVLHGESQSADRCFAPALPGEGGEG